MDLGLRIGSFDPDALLLTGLRNFSTANDNGDGNAPAHLVAQQSHSHRNGADLRYVRQMLGHARLNTTEIYTHVNIQKLIEVHRLTHPAKLPETKPGATCHPAAKDDIIPA